MTATLVAVPNAPVDHSDAPDTHDPAEPRFTPDALRALEADVAAVERAITALSDGTDGTCTVCGTSIDPAALRADPLLSRCLAHPA